MVVVMRMKDLASLSLRGVGGWQALDLSGRFSFASSLLGSTLSYWPISDLSSCFRLLLSPDLQSMVLRLRFRAVGPDQNTTQTSLVILKVTVQQTKFRSGPIPLRHFFYLQGTFSQGSVMLPTLK